MSGFEFAPFLTVRHSARNIYRCSVPHMCIVLFMIGLHHHSKDLSSRGDNCPTAHGTTSIPLILVRLG